MGAYSIDDLIQRWGQHDLTPEQVIGQMLLVLQESETPGGRFGATDAAGRDYHSGRRR